MNKNLVDLQYLELCKLVHPNEHNVRKDRTGVGTFSTFGAQIRMDLRKEFPLLSCKKINFAHIVHEIIWTLSGDTNVKYLNDNNIKIWDDWADEDGELGPVYGKQWRRWEGPDGFVDQVKNCLDTLKNNPFSRRNLILGFNPADQPKVAPQGCHTMAQFYYHPTDHGKPGLSCHVYQRSADLMIGVPYDLAMYGFLMHLFALECGFEVRDLVYSFGDLHVYSNHQEGFQTVFERLLDMEAEEYKKYYANTVPDGNYNFNIDRQRTQLVHTNWSGIENIKAEDFELVNYKPGKFVPFKIAV